MSHEELTEMNDSTFNIDNLECITLKKPNEFYYEIYQKAKEKAKKAKKEMMIAYLEAKNIKKTYMLNDLDGSDSSSEDDSLNNDLEMDTLNYF